MLAPNEVVRSLQERVRSAAANREQLIIRAGGTKDFYGNRTDATPGQLDPRQYCGLLDYEPTELCLTACSGTPLSEIEHALEKHNQMLAFEPPCFGSTATLGGAIASGLSGPRRVSAGSVRDFVLGATLLDGRGNVLTFGGKVMKNVAGYDVSRALAGSLGTLGVILDVSLKVVPRPAVEQTLQFELAESEAIQRTNVWAGQPLPVSATAWIDGVLSVRLSGSNAGVRAACAKLGGDLLNSAAEFWNQLREQTHAFFKHTDPVPVWRLSVPPSTAPLNLGATLIEWRGGQRWICSTAHAAEIRACAKNAGGHATAFRNATFSNVFHPLSPVLQQIHRRLKDEFDPMRLFNPGRMFPDA